MPAVSDTGRVRRILVIDDDRETVDLLAQALAREGFEASTALCGEEDISRRRHQPPEIILLRYTPEGSTVTVDAWLDGPAGYRIAVRDRGPGVPAEYIGAIFDPFYRAPQSPNEEPAGFGIGLATAKRAVALHHGAISAGNPDGGGFEVTIRLPVVAA